MARPWDWSGVVGTGQSLAVGQMGTPVATTTQPYHNLKLTTGNLPWPIDPNNAALAISPLVEPIGRLSSAYPSSWPTNIAGETPHASMANEITALVRAADGGDYVGVHGEVGENGQGIAFLRKNATPVGVNGHAYQATLIETQAITRLARAMGKTYGVAVITVTHGESDAGSASYESDLYKLLSDYQTDLPGITGQTQKIQMIVSQQNSVNDRSPSTLAEWKIGVDHPTDVVCSGPKYQYPYYAGDHVHLVTDGLPPAWAKNTGRSTSSASSSDMTGGRWPPPPSNAARAWLLSTSMSPWRRWPGTQPSSCRTRRFPSGKRAKDSNCALPRDRLAIASVEIAGDAVQIVTAADLPPTGVMVGYALTGDATAMTTPFVGTFRWGLLRDSDPFVGTATKTAQPNYAVAFELPVP